MSRLLATSIKEVMWDGFGDLYILIIIESKSKIVVSYGPLTVHMRICLLLDGANLRLFEKISRRTASVILVITVMGVIDVIRV